MANRRPHRFCPARSWSLVAFDHERQVTGLEFGMNPNYPYLHASVFNLADDWDAPYEHDLGYGGALSAGYRDLGWHTGASVIYGQRETSDDQMGWTQVGASLQWALNLFVLANGLPLTYLGEYHLLHTSPDDQAKRIGLSSFHELGWLLTRGFNVTTRYDWNDPDIEFRYNTQHRINIGFEWHPVPFLEVITRYRHNWKHIDDRFKFDSDEVLVVAWVVLDETRSRPRTRCPPADLHRLASANTCPSRDSLRRVQTAALVEDELRRIGRCKHGHARTGVVATLAVTNGQASRSGQISTRSI